MTGLKLDVLRMLRIFGPCSNAEIARRLKEPSHRTYRVLYLLCEEGFAVHPKLQVWELSEQGREHFAKAHHHEPRLFDENGGER